MKNRIEKLLQNKKCRDYLMRGGAIAVAVALLLTSINVSAYAEIGEEAVTEATEQVLSEPTEQISSEPIEPTPSEATEQSAAGQTEQGSAEATNQSDINSTVITDENQQDSNGILPVDVPESLLDEVPSKKDVKEEAKAGADAFSGVFSESISVDGVKITIEADAGVFHDEAYAEARKVSADEANRVEEAVEDVRNEEKNVAASYTFDITIFDKDGNEIEPDQTKGSVKVKFEMEEISNTNLETEVYHVEETDSGLDVTALEVEEVDGNEDAVVVETEGFSYYTVEFTYGELQYVLPGDSRVELTTILDTVGIDVNGEITEVIGSNDDLFKPVNEGDVWYVEAVTSFTSTEWLKVTIGETEYEIVVTDAVSDYIPLKCLRLNYDSNMKLLTSAYQNLTIPYQIPSQTTKYKWELTFSDLRKTFDSRRGSVVGIYGSSRRSGYLFSEVNTTTFQVCVGDNHRGAAYDLSGTDKNTVTVEYDGSAKTYSINDKLGRTNSQKNGSWSGYYPVNQQFNLDSCATPASYSDTNAEFVALKFYEVKVWEWQNGAYKLMVDMIPVKMKSGGTYVPGVFDVVTGKFQDKPSYGTSNFAFEENTTKIIFDNQGATTAGTTELSFSPGTTLMTITPPTKTGCTFDGYYSGINGTGTKYYDKSGKSLATYTSTNNLTLYAKWIHNHSMKYYNAGDKFYAYCNNAADNSQCTMYAANDSAAASASGIPSAVITAPDMSYTGSAYSSASVAKNNSIATCVTTVGNVYYTTKGTTTTISAPINAGSYDACCDITVGSSKYTIRKTFTISKINRGTVTVNMSDYAYAQTTALPTPSVSGALESPSITYYYSSSNQTSGGTAWNAMTSEKVAVGTYYMYAVVGETTNYYSCTTATKSFKVNPGSCSITKDPTANNTTYDGNAKSLVNAGEVKYGTMHYSLDGTNYSTDIPTGKDAKIYMVYYKGVSDGTHTTGETAVKTVSVTIGKAICTVSAPPTGKTDLKYTGNAQELLATPGSVAGGTMNYSTAKDGIYSTSIPTGTNAGTYSVWYKGIGDANHEDSTPVEIKVSIAKVPCEVTAPTALNLTYTGEPQALVNAGSAGSGATKVQYSSEQNGTYADTIPTGTNAGQYSVWYKGIGDSNHENSTPQEVKVTIAKADCSYTAPKGKENLKYTGSAQELVEAGSTSDGTIYYSLKETEDYSTDVPKGTAKDEYTVWYKIAGDSNHNDVEPQSITVVIDRNVRATITVLMDDYTYEQTTSLPTPITSPAKDELYETPDITYFYNTTGSTEGGEEWKSIDSTTLSAGTYYMYAVVEQTDSYLEYTTAAKAFNVNKSTTYAVEPPIGKLTYGQKLSEATFEGGSAEKQGTFDWADSVKGEMPDATAPGSDPAEYEMVFTPSGDDAINYAPVTVSAKVIVAPKKANPEISNIKVTANPVTVTETVKELDLGVTLTDGTDYEKEAVKEPEKSSDTSINYTITYTFKGNYTGTTTKKVSIPKGQKPDDNIISTAQSDQKAKEKYNPEIKPVSYDDAKKVINDEIKKVSQDPSSDQKGKAQAIVDKLGTLQEDDIVYDAELSVEMKALESAPVDDAPKVEEEAANIPRVNKDDIRYIDISVFLTYTAQIGDDATTKVIQSKEPIHDMSNIDVKETITMDVPADMRIVPSGYDRTYYVIRAHKNADDTIETSIIAQTKSTSITITSDKFSTYALLYSDSLKPEEPEEPSGGSSNSTTVTPPVAVKPAAGLGYASPKTGDTKELYVLIGLLLIGVAVFVSGSRKKTSR